MMEQEEIEEKYDLEKEAQVEKYVKDLEEKGRGEAERNYAQDSEKLKKGYSKDYDDYFRVKKIEAKLKKIVGTIKERFPWLMFWSKNESENNNS